LYYKCKLEYIIINIIENNMFNTSIIARRLLRSKQMAASMISA